MTPLGRRVRSACLSMLGWAMLATGAVAPAWGAPDEPPQTTRAAEDLWTGDFAALDSRNAALRESGAMTAEGRPELMMFRNGIRNVIGHQAKPREPYIRELEELTLQWTRQYPQSALAHILHARVLVEHGWSYRGGSFASKVSPQQMVQFERYLRQALEYLKMHGEVALTDSYAHLTLLEIGRALGFQRKHMESIVQDGLKRNPRDMELYFEVGTSLLPKWGGDAQALDKYIRQVATQTRSQYGAGMYGWMYSSAALGQYQHGLFKDTLAEWPLIQQGYEDILERYPDAVGRRNRYAYFACMAQDKATLQEQLAKIGTGLKISEWGDNGERSLEGCQRLANEI
ncbi:hypothetical protein SAMN03159300_105225 [Janthinobacterium sp. 344]|uniref:DUF4034 domain-containing protein n=1 Tax=Janthinobacterium sp. 344 TaxID=1566280 RepID=UPI0008E5138C|nr:DUF4034 domain-containing protein [Janthinobacterium sp. 344]SFB47337.1 hypothetical protein SAMN03159300_105225 [Janthinobacterium sp. 344]